MLPTPVEQASIPAATFRVATAICPEGHRLLRLRATLGPLFQSADFVPRFPALGQPALAPARLARVTVFQLLAGLADRPAADHVRRCLAWQDALALPLEAPGLDASVLSEFRTRLITGQAAHVWFETLLTRLREQGLRQARGRQRTDSTQVLAAIRVLQRLTCVGETLRRASAGVSLHDHEADGRAREMGERAVMGPKQLALEGNHAERSAARPPPGTMARRCGWYGSCRPQGGRTLGNPGSAVPLQRASWASRVRVGRGGAQSVVRKARRRADTRA